MAFRVIGKAGQVDKRKTNKLKRQLHKSCDKIRQTITDETNKFKELANAEKIEDCFWMHAAHQAMLYLEASSDDDSAYLSAEIGDLFASQRLLDPEHFNTSLDIERLQKMKEKEEKKLQEKEKKLQEKENKK